MKKYIIENEKIFSEVWEKIIKDTIKDFCDEFSEIKVPQWARVKRKIGKCYNKYALEFVMRYMKSETKKIDRHKICACMVKSILQARPLRIPFKYKINLLFKKDLLETDSKTQFLILCNELFALSVAFDILNSYIEADPEKVLKHNVIAPSTFTSNDKLNDISDYIRSTCVDLYYTKAKKFNYITYANIFFLLEKYSCRKTRYNNLEKEYYKYLYDNYSLLISGNVPNGDLITKEESNKLLEEIQQNQFLRNVNKNDLLVILVENRIFNAQLEIPEDNINEIDEDKLSKLIEINNSRK